MTPDDIEAHLAADTLTATEASAGHLNPQSRPGTWQVVGKRHLSYDNGCGQDVQAIDVTGGPAMWHEQIWVKNDPHAAVARHVARHDPARALREVAVFRAILAEHHPAPREAQHARACARCVIPWPCPTIRALAKIWKEEA